jgi:hypothetical protein
VAEQLGIKLHIIDVIEEYRDVLLNPKHGYGISKFCLFFVIAECDVFLCSDCLKQHKSSKVFKNHSAMSLEDYKELPTVVQAMRYQAILLF